MVWRIYLLTTNDEHLITLQGGFCVEEKEARICLVGFLALIETPV